MTSINLVHRAGQVNLNIGTSSSGDDATTLGIPFGKLDSSGFPNAIQLSIQSSSGVSIPQEDITCQAFKDTRGTITLGSTFTDSKPASLGSNTARIGSVFCSDAKGVKARVGAAGSGSGSSATTGDDADSSVAATDPGSSSNPSAILTTMNSNMVDSPSHATIATDSAASQQPKVPSSVAATPSVGDSKPKTPQQSSASSSTMVTRFSSTAAASLTEAVNNSATSAGTDQVTDASSTVNQLAASTTSASGAVQQGTDGASNAITYDGWTLKKMLSIVLVTGCYMAIVTP